MRIDGRMLAPVDVFGEQVYVWRDWRPDRVNRLRRAVERAEAAAREWRLRLACVQVGNAIGSIEGGAYGARLRRFDSGR